MTILLFINANILAGEYLLLRGIEYPNHETKNRICISFDSSIISEYQNTVKQDTTPDYLCGYHWEFLKTNGITKYERYLVNKHCNSWFINSAVYKRFMNKCGGDGLSTPTHYLYNIGFPITIPPRSILRKYNNEILFQFDTLSILPRIRFAVECTVMVTDRDYARASERADKEAFSIVSKIISEVSSMHDTVFAYVEKASSGGGRGIEYSECLGIVYFKYQENIDEINAVLKKYSAKRIQIIQPKDYSIQVAFPTETEFNAIKNRFPEAISLSEYIRNTGAFDK